MHKQAPVSDPFAMLMDLQSVVQAMERSDRLARLQSRICRPLDKPLGGVASSESGDDGEEAGPDADRARDDV